MNLLQKSTSVATINKTQIAVIDQKNELFVPIKPICDALGIAFQPQLTKLKEDEFYSSTITLSVTVGADGKNREMASLPLKYALMWLGSINAKNVAPEAKESVLRYKEACASALYDYFFGYVRFVRSRNVRLVDLRAKKTEAKQRFALAKNDIKEIEQEEMEIMTETYESFLANNAQTQMNFPEMEEGDVR
jgi:hypothetical protein